MKFFRTTFFASAICFLTAATFAAPIAVLAVKKDAHGITLQMNPGVMRLEVYSPRIIRVTYALQDELPDLASLAVIGGPQRTRWTWSETGDEITLRTDEVQARVNRVTGAVSFFDALGEPILAENSNGGKSLTPVRINGMATLRSRAGISAGARGGDLWTGPAP